MTTSTTVTTFAMLQAGYHIKPRDRPSGEATGGEEPPPRPTTTTPFSLDGVAVDTSTPAAQSQSAVQCSPHRKMLFSDLYKNHKSPLSKLRHSLPHPIPVLPPGLDEDLVSRDKVKQKEAVKRFLAERVRNDWEFTWPPQQPSQHVGQSQAPDSKLATLPAAFAGSTPDQVESHTNLDPAGASPTPGAAANTGVTPLTAAPDSEIELTPKDPGEEADLESDAESVYSTVSEDAQHFRPRTDWASDFSDDDDDPQPSKPILSPFRFDTPDSVGVAVQSATRARRARRRRELRQESVWNDGLACYNARRDAWTGARTVRVKPRPTPVTTPVSPVSPRRLFWRTHSRDQSASSITAGAPLTPVVSGPPASYHGALSPTATNVSAHSWTTPSSEDAPPCTQHPSSTSTTTTPPRTHYPVETLLPIPAPLIPPQNPMRASITPQIYPSLYDKVVVHSLQPSCPVNLSDMVASCVAGWKRDGEWPPRSAPAGPSVVAVRRRKSDAGQKKHQLQQQNQENQHGRKESAAAIGEKARRLSFGFLGRGERKSGEGERKEKDEEAAGKVLEKGGVTAKEKERAEEDGGGAGKGIRRSLQKVFAGLGHHQHDNVQGAVVM